MIENMKKLKQLGTGKTSDVFLYQNNQGQKLAVKQFKSEIGKQIHDQEVSILCELDHPNIISMVSHTSDNIAFEFASSGDIFDYALSKPFEPELARYYMIQLINVLDYIHQQNICHRDLKLENLFLDENFQLKVGDFGLSSFLNSASSQNTLSKQVSSEEMSLNTSSTECSDASSDESHWLYESVGTETYMAPELINKQRYLGEQVDIFAFGVILFSLIHGFPPYQRIAHISDPFYRLLIEKKYAKYWTILEKKTHIKCESSFIDLMNKLLEPNPQKRITLEEIKCHPWMHGEICSQEELVQSMKLRQAAFAKN
ncbi:protein kinase (macronuclear) [Tetrahymena thermophila SB210]|uniref:non-specific serine/threonine protein kinase n=1 Tax=Tetrahymena thermophila (strain SB210) TaxID=312017 RepID=I7MJD3_TETTS|nr:protein kinase [Tetrahymena thermophila SB210]EAS06166.2 protein kinase [Tetrahymena thermophila SB210]|eukprot:XP_001026411.2 protein kinase [Tetrahymena thermophila SB210]